MVPEVGARQTYVQTAELELTGSPDEQAPGAAITVKLCGHWDHAGPCRWPHHTSVVTTDDATQVRTRFLAVADDEAAVRQQLSEALGAGELAGPEGTVTWSLTALGQEPPNADDCAWAERAARSSG